MKVRAAYTVPVSMDCQVAAAWFAYALQVNGLTRKSEKIMRVLHGEPALGRATDRLGEAQGHLGRN